MREDREARMRRLPLGRSALDLARPAAARLLQPQVHKHVGLVPPKGCLLGGDLLTLLSLPGPLMGMWILNVP